MQERHSNLKIAAILLLALGVRLLGIASRPIWYDEAFSVLFAEKGPSAMLYGTLTTAGGGAAEEHPLGYYVLLWSWMKVFGESLVAVRLLSIVGGIVSVYLIYLIALEVLSETKIARLSMLFAALAPFQVHYAQEIRMYSFLALWLLLATYAYQRASRAGNWKWWLLFSLAAALAQYTHHLAAFYLIALALLPVFKRDWKTVYSMTIAGMGALILYLPWALQLPAQFAKVGNTYWVARPDISSLFTLLLVFITNIPLPDKLITAALAIVLIVFAAGVFQTIIYTRQTGKKDGLWLLYLSFAPPLFLFLFSQWKPVYVERALLPSGAIFCIWLAWAIRRTSPAKVVQYFLLGLLVISSGLGIFQHVSYHGFPYGPFKELDVSLRERFEAKDVIIHSNKLSCLPAILFDRELSQSFIGDPPGSTTDTLAPATQQVLNVTAEKDIRSAAGDSKRVWYIIYQRSIDEYKASGAATHPDIEYLNSQYNLESTETWDGLQVFLYTKKP